jgi:hypothetical protein
MELETRDEFFGMLKRKIAEEQGHSMEFEAIYMLEDLVWMSGRGTLRIRSGKPSVSRGSWLGAKFEVIACASDMSVYRSYALYCSSVKWSNRHIRFCSMAWKYHN